jgi:cytochrome oxidase assembly protein ShyY1
VNVYRFLLTRQWVILTLLGLVLIPVMIELGIWQLHRHEQKAAQNDLIVHSLKAAPVPVDKLTGVGREPVHDDQFRSVRASGHYDTAHEVVVRQRTAADEQSIGYFVLTPLIRDDGTAVLVNRGWIPTGNDLTKFPHVPAPPGGHVTVTGRMMIDETTADSGIKDKKGLPPRMVMLIDSHKMAKTLKEPVLGGYVQLTASSPSPEHHPQRVPDPDHSSIGRHIAYTVQWWIFAAGVPVAWLRLVRREVRDREAAAAREAPSESEDAPTDDTPTDDTPTAETSADDDPGSDDRETAGTRQSSGD